MRRPSWPPSLWLAVILAGCAGENELPWPTEFPDNPEDATHFDGVTDPFYEGWYHRVSIPETGEAFFFIYSVINPAPSSPGPALAFLYCGRAKTLQTAYQTFPVSAYRAASGHQDVRIGTARTTALRFAGEAQDGQHQCAWDLQVAGPLAWNQTMGWMTGVAGLETSWTVGALEGQHTGWVRFDGERYNLKGAPGYCDHNWGAVFPASWIWMQANGFAGVDAALAASGGTVKLGDSEVEASMLGLWHDGVLTAFRSQDLDAMTMASQDGTWQIDGARDLERIHVEASCDPATFFHLLVPTEAGMQPRAFESLLGEVQVTLEERDNTLADWRQVFTGSSVLAGVERGE